MNYRPILELLLVVCIAHVRCVSHSTQLQNRNAVLPTEINFMQHPKTSSTKVQPLQNNGRGYLKVYEPPNLHSPKPQRVSNSPIAKFSYIQPNPIKEKYVGPKMTSITHLDENGKVLRTYMVHHDAVQQQRLSAGIHTFPVVQHQQQQIQAHYASHSRKEPDVELRLGRPGSPSHKVPNRYQPYRPTFYSRSHRNPNEPDTSLHL